MPDMKIKLRIQIGVKIYTIPIKHFNVVTLKNNMVFESMEREIL